MMQGKLSFKAFYHILLSIFIRKKPKLC